MSTDRVPTARQDAIDPSVEVTEPTQTGEQLSTSDTSPNDAKKPSESGSKSPSQAAIDTTTSPPPPNAWQAILSPQHNAYYFYNTQTHETTWTNPLQPASGSSSDPSMIEPHGSTSSSSNASQNQSPPPSAQPFASTSTTASSSHHAALQAAALAAGIDPSLAYLDPSLAAGPAGGPAPNTFTAKFNARTGAFTAGDARDPSHLSEFERAKRMSEFYFDVSAWEKDVEERKRAEKEEEESGVGGKRKRPSKKDLERFKEQKKQKKIAKTAWLRN